MEGIEAPAQGTKRTLDGQKKPRDSPTIESQRSDERTPTCAQPPKEAYTSSQLAHKNQHNKHISTWPSKNKQKLPRLPDNVTISKRSLHHPPIPPPFSSSSSPKVVYITRTSSFIPAIKRIRKLLSEIQKRQTQSINSLRPNGRLNNVAVEKAVAEGMSAGSRTEGRNLGEEVYVKATGRAIQRALEIGVHFQGQVDCKVRVELGTVSAVDDIELNTDSKVSQESDENDVGMGAGGENKGKKNKRRKKNMISEDDIPETRIRSLSTVKIAICLV